MLATVSRSLTSRTTVGAPPYCPSVSQCVDGSVECLDRADEGRRRCCHQGDAGWLASCCRSAARRVLCEEQEAGRYTLARTDLLAAHSGQPDVPLQAVDMASRWRPAHQRTDRDRNGACARARAFGCRLVRGPLQRAAPFRLVLGQCPESARQRQCARTLNALCAHCEAAPWLVSRADGRSVTRDVAEQPIRHATSSHSPCMNSHRGQAYGR